MILKYDFKVDKLKLYSDLIIEVYIIIPKLVAEEEKIKSKKY